VPTVLRIGGFRFFFFSNEGDEPPHIHVERAESHAKFWLVPDVRLESAYRFRRSDLTRVQRWIEENQELFLEKWDEHFEGQD
jgi:hypothetical protein